MKRFNLRNLELGFLLTSAVACSDPTEVENNMEGCLELDRVFYEDTSETVSGPYRGRFVISLDKGDVLGYGHFNVTSSLYGEYTVLFGDYWGLHFQHEDSLKMDLHYRGNVITWLTGTYEVRGSTLHADWSGEDYDLQLKWVPTECPDTIENELENRTRIIDFEEGTTIELTRMGFL
jgi:hypothetical protein